MPRPDVPQKVCRQPGVRSDGKPYAAPPDDGRRLRWRQGVRRLPVTPSQRNQLLRSLERPDAQPRGLTPAQARHFEQRVEAFLAGTFFDVTDGEPMAVGRIPIPAAEYRRLRQVWRPSSWLPKVMDSTARRLVAERVRDLINRTFTVRPDQNPT